MDLLLGRRNWIEPSQIGSYQGMTKWVSHNQRLTMGKEFCFTS